MTCNGFSILSSIVPCSKFFSTTTTFIKPIHPARALRLRVCPCANLAFVGHRAAAVLGHSVGDMSPLVSRASSARRWSSSYRRARPSHGRLPQNGTMAVLADASPSSPPSNLIKIKFPSPRKTDPTTRSSLAKQQRCKPSRRTYETGNFVQASHRLPRFPLASNGFDSGRFRIRRTPDSLPCPPHLSRLEPARRYSRT